MRRYVTRYHPFLALDFGDQKIATHVLLVRVVTNKHVVLDPKEPTVRSLQFDSVGDFQF